MHKSRFTGVVALAAAGLLMAGTLPASSSPADTGTHTVQVAHSKSSSAHHDGKGGKHKKPTAKQPKTTVVAEHLAGPLSFAVAGRNKIYVGQAFTGALTLLRTGKAPTDVVVRPGLDVAAVSTHHGSLTWAETTLVNDVPAESVLVRKSPNGKVRTVANIFAYERKANPDRTVTYGPIGLSKTCRASLPADLPDGVGPYRGLVDSHPYGSTTVGRNTYVADAGANALFRVSNSGRVSTVAVLPPAKFTITAELAASVGLPDCTVGHKFALESVPTDVEVGRDGYLYVTTLPGGPEDGSLGALGSVYRVNPRTGAVKRVATGLSGATGLAIDNHGKIYVAEMFADRVSTISKHGKVKPLITLTQPAAVEYRAGRLYVSTNALGDGNIVSMRAK